MDRALDIEDIRRLTHLYFWGWDTNDVDSVVGIFTPDAVHDERNVQPELAQGHAEIRALFERVRPNLAHCFHLAGSHLIEFTGEDTARGTSVYDATVVTTAGIHAGGKGYFEDTYTRTAAGWRIATRTTHSLMPAA